MPNPRTSGATFLSKLAELVGHRMRGAGIEAARAEAICIAMREDLRQHFGGVSIYISRRSMSTPDLAAKAYRMRCDEMSINDIAARLSFTPRWVRRLLAIHAQSDTRPRSSKTTTRRMKHLRRPKRGAER